MMTPPLQQQARKSTGRSRSLPELSQRFDYARLQGYFQKAKHLFFRLEAKANLDNIPLPLFKREIEPGQEWIKGAMLCAWGTALILILNAILTIIAAGVGYSKSSGDKYFTYTELYEGSCSVTDSWTTGMHFIINILSAALLAASNYVMQCLSAPSRADVDRAHSRRKWLDIGVLSTRNLAVMDNKRKILWALLFISSFPIHMLYNAAIFSSISTIQYATVVIPQDLGKNESLVKDELEARLFQDYVGSSANDIRAQISNETFVEKDMLECSKKFNVEYNTETGTLLLIADRDSLHGSSSLLPLDGAYGLGDGIFGQDPAYYFDFDPTQNRAHTYAGSWNYPEWLFKYKGANTWSGIRGFTYYSSRPDSVDYTQSTNMSSDMDTLVAFIFNQNPDERHLGEFLMTSSNWRNDSWAAQIEFRIDGDSVSRWREDGSFDNSVYSAVKYLNSDSKLPPIVVSGCMTKDASQHCQFYFSPAICIAVLACNMVKVFCMYMTARTDHKEIFLTVGDALSSFLDKPDPNTNGHNIIYRLRPWNRRVLSSEAINFAPFHDTNSHTSLSQLFRKRKRWFRAASWRRWALTYTVYYPQPQQIKHPLISSRFSVCMAASIFLYYLGTALVYVGGVGSNLGMGNPNSSTLLFDGADSIALSLLANTPQLVFSALYLLCNGLFTSMLAVAEYNDFANQRKTLRVTWPKGGQRSTYYLSLPYRYSLPLIGVSVFMHWLLSQCIFLVKINSFDVHGDRFFNTEDQTTACGWSPLPMFITIVIGGTCMIALLGFGFRRLRSNMPLVSYSSAALSAACHPPPGDEDASLKPVMWGEVRGDSSNGSNTEDHGSRYAQCSFTSKEVTTPSMVQP